MELRPYQKEAKEAIFEQWDSGVLKTLLVLPTGCGKTVVFAKVTEECVRKGDRVLILAHRGELLDQAADKLMKTTGLGCALEKAESSCQGSWFRVVVGSVQTLMREKRLGSFPADYFNTIIIDEAHHCMTDNDIQNLYKLPTVFFVYKPGYLEKDSAVPIPGLYAEDVEQYLPLAARYQNGLIEDWNERAVIPYLIKAIQQQHEEIEALKRKVA